MKGLPVYKKKSKHPLYNSTKLSTCRKDILRLSQSSNSRCFQGGKDERAVHTLYRSYFRVVRSVSYVKAFKTPSEFQNSRNVCCSRHSRLPSVKNVANSSNFFCFFLRTNLCEKWSLQVWNIFVQANSGLIYFPCKIYGPNRKCVRSSVSSICIRSVVNLGQGFRLQFGPGGTPLYKLFRYVPPQRRRVFAPFWSENGYSFCPCWSGYRVWFSRDLRECINVFIVSIPNE